MLELAIGIAIGHVLTRMIWRKPKPILRWRVKAWRDRAIARTPTVDPVRQMIVNCKAAFAYLPQQDLASVLSFCYWWMAEERKYGALQVENSFLALCDAFRESELPQELIDLVDKVRQKCADTAAKCAVGQEHATNERSPDQGPVPTVS